MRVCLAILLMKYLPNMVQIIVQKVNFVGSYFCQIPFSFAIFVKNLKRVGVETKT